MRQKVADFLVCRRDFTIAAVVELDDRSHRNKHEQDKARDEVCKQAGLLVFRQVCLPFGQAVSHLYVCQDRQVFGVQESSPSMCAPANGPLSSQPARSLARSLRSRHFKTSTGTVVLPEQYALYVVCDTPSSLALDLQSSDAARSTVMSRSLGTRGSLAIEAKARLLAGSNLA